MIAERLKQKIIEKEASIAVLGLGYVGLPLAVSFAEAGFCVQGIDTATDKVEQLNRGYSPVMDVVTLSIQKVIKDRLLAGSNFSVLSSCDVVIICVPTPLNDAREPDLSSILYAVKQIIKHISEQTLLVLESTTYPGTTEELIIEVIEIERNWVVGRDFYVCCSPERVDPGNKAFSIHNTPKVIGGATNSCLEMGVALYSSIVKNIVPVTSTRIAEMVKLLENTFRSVNIALINELAQMADKMKINIWEVIDAAATKPFGFMPFYPGPGIGGHCIPLDPVYLQWKAKSFGHYNRFIGLATDINANMPEYLVRQIGDILNQQGKPIKNSRIMLIGLAYKKDIDDLRESPSIKVFNLLKQRKALLSYYDPFIPSFKVGEGEVYYSCELSCDSLENSDLIVIATDHSEIDYRFIVKNAPLVLDAKNATRGINESNIYLLGGVRKENRALVEEVENEESVCL